MHSHAWSVEMADMPVRLLLETLQSANLAVPCSTRDAAPAAYVDACGGRVVDIAVRDVRYGAVDGHDAPPARGRDVAVVNDCRGGKIGTLGADGPAIPTEGGLDLDCRVAVPYVRALGVVEKPKSTNVHDSLPDPDDRLVLPIRLEREEGARPRAVETGVECIHVRAASEARRAVSRMRAVDRVVAVPSATAEGQVVEGGVGTAAAEDLPQRRRGRPASHAPCIRPPVRDAWRRSCRGSDGGRLTVVVLSPREGVARVDESAHGNALDGHAGAANDVEHERLREEVRAGVDEDAARLARRKRLG
ncbi:hypothetical protein THAOC_05689 [Thalassiosira oceanica]|uniref:Uncharacterized protein n=1 Tax=Thalassiosira oceanica TaxID=159749 RepID=K0TGL0_THAOC|nr:hypothetical protein THAOC_05689 [Thalassiosira oceanica]|eukprot:EJK72746.1 hypothetical protein THAOC_05689 [Thalassiosira oceanica]